MKHALGPIQVLSQQLIHRIAAGEVVDRPASVLKELIENALDAESSKIRAVIVDGGIGRLEVEDNGFGMTRHDLQACVQRHATSKIQSLEDLDAIESLGFRGEALAALSSVSRLQIESVRAAEGPWRLVIQGGDREALLPGTREQGTRVVAEDLFFNTPARRKFLRSAGAEASDCVQVLEAYSLLYPAVEFEWHVVSATGEIKDQAHFLHGELANRFSQWAKTCVGPQQSHLIEQSLIDIVAKSAAPGIDQLRILALRPPFAQRTQKGIFLSVNGRWVQDKRLGFALREAYAGLIEVGSFPIVLVSIEADPHRLDVNIHPQKKEIRWPHGFSLGGLVYRHLRPQFEIAQRPQNSAENSSMDRFVEHAAAAQPQMFSQPDGALESQQETSSFIPSLDFSRFTENAPQEVRPPFDFSSLRVVGEVGAAWIVCESERGLVVIDQHAAAERVEFERILSEIPLFTSKPLLIPMALRLPLAVESIRSSIISALEDLHFEVDATASDSRELSIIAVPQCERKVDWQKEFEQLFERLGEGENVNSVKEDLRVRIASSLACHGSVRRGQRLSHPECKALLSSLSKVQWGGYCPHGRPLWFEITHAQVENLFHR